MKGIMTQHTFLLGNLKYTEGTASIPLSSDNRVIINLVGLNGEWPSSKISTELSNRWFKAKEQYRKWYRSQDQFKLGSAQTVQVQSDTAITNLLVLNNGSLDLEAFKKAVENISKEIIINKQNVHIQKIENNWDEIEKILIEFFVKKGTNVVIYK